MKTPRTTSSYSYSSSYNQKIWENFASRLEESSKHAKKTTKTHAKEEHRENERCEISYEIVENKMKGSFEPQNCKEEEKPEVMEEKVEVIIDDNEEERKEPLEKNMVGNCEVEEGKIVIIDDGVDMEVLLGDNDAGEGGEGNSDNGGVVGDLMKVQNEDTFSIEDNEGDLFPGWNQWKFELEQKWHCSYPFWQTENNALKFWDVEPPANDWVVSLWQL